MSQDLLNWMADWREVILAGAGLLGASWRGVGLVVESWIADSIPNLLVALFLIVCLNGLLFRLLRRRRSTVVEEARREDRR